MKLNELTYPREKIKSSKRGTVDSVLFPLGFKKIGSAGSANVYSHPKLSYVVKVFVSDDTCYMNFVRMVKQNSNNPHFPKFRGELMKLSRELYGIRMEKLAPVSGVSRELANTIKEHMQFGAKLPDAIRLQNPKLLDAMALVQDLDYSNCFYDLHNGNFMMRGNTIVFIDPYGTI